MKLLQVIRRWFQRVFRPRSRSLLSRREKWAGMYESLILRQGRDVSDETLANARGLGLTVEALFAEHDRLKAASWRIEFVLDLAGLHPDDPELTEKLRKSGVPGHEIETHGRQLSVSLCSLYKLIDLPKHRMPVIEMISLGVAGIHQRLAEAPDEFPANRYPNGARDWQLESLSWSEAEQRLYLSGSWKPEVRGRLPSELSPEASIELRRTPFAPKKLVSAKPIPELKKVFLNIWRWPGGKHVVMGIYTDEESCPASAKSPRPEQADTLLLAFPSKNLPSMQWDARWHETAAPGLEFFFRSRCQEFGKPFDWLKAWTREVLFEDDATSVPATDFRASLRSGPTGPAPLPKGLRWPCCPCCGEPVLFSQSVDVRDISFADLLPGTTMVIFVCNECHIAGEWQNCAILIWLGRNDEVVLQDRESPAPLLQRGQWHGAELIDAQDLPEDVAQELEAFEKAECAPCYPQCYGTKVGGVPAYLQQKEFFYDRNGLVMEYIAQIATPDHISAGGFGYVYFSSGTGETYIEFQDT